MTRARIGSLVLIGVVVAVVIFGSGRGARVVEPKAPRSERVARLKTAVPELPLSALDVKMEESDAIRRAQGTVNIDERMRSVQLTEAELRDFHARNYEIFQGRSFEESMISVDVLARLQRVRAELGLPPSSRIR